MKALTPILLCFILTGILFQNCQNSGNTDNNPKEVVDSLPDLKSRTSNVRGMTAEELFLRVPNEAIQLEGWDKLSVKNRKELIQKGRIDALSATIDGNHLSIVEQFQNEDDETERAASLDIVVFRHSEEETNIIFVGQKYIHEDKRRSDELVSQKFWQYDGKNWSDITASIPTIETNMFFDKDFDVRAATEHFILLGAAKINENTLSATLLYENYGKFGIKPEKMITNESYAMNLIWNGQSFELQRKPNQLN